MSEQKKQYLLFGYPVKHTFSPAMHNAAFQALGINARYEACEVAPDALEKAIDDVRAQGIAGFNVTIPHKETVIPYLDVLDPVAERIGAVNTVVNDDGILTGYNTDAYGFARALKEHYRTPDVSGCKVFVMGSGGACRALCASLADEKIASFTVTDIRAEAALKLVNHFKKYYEDRGIAINELASSQGQIKETLSEADILINATGIGMKTSDPLLVQPDWLHKDLFVGDLIYNPAEPALLRVAREQGLQTMNGLDMLMYQGARAFELWTGQEAPVDIMRKAIEDMLKK